MSISGVGAMTRYDAWKLSDGEDAAAQKYAEAIDDAATSCDSLIEAATKRTTLPGGLTFEATGAPLCRAVEVDGLGNRLGIAVQPPAIILGDDDDMIHYADALATWLANLRLVARGWK